jgi:hypothetical protein
MVSLDDLRPCFLVRSNGGHLLVFGLAIPREAILILTMKIFGYFPSLTNKDASRDFLVLFAATLNVIGGAKNQREVADVGL